MSTKFFVSSNPETLAALNPSAPVEAEYGSVCVEGSLLTMAHHGERSGNPAPCSGKYAIPRGINLVGLSHLDLDSIGGCAEILGCRPTAPSFWAAAEYVDLNGPHRLAALNPSEKTVRQLHAFWAWSESHRTFPPRDGSVADVTDFVWEALQVLEYILTEKDPETRECYLRAGDEHRAAGERLNAESFRSAEGGVVIRVWPGFTNHLYNTPTGEVCRAVVALNTTNASVTVSFADDASRGTRNAREIVQGLWGELAGGHDNIAGSPRGATFGEAELLACAEAVRASLQ